MEAEGTPGPQAVAPIDPNRAIAVDTPVAKPVPKRNVITRRMVLLGGFWTAVGLLIVGLVGAPLDFMWLRKTGGFGGPITVTPDRIPQPGGDPVIVREGRFYLLNLEAGTVSTGQETPGGALALWRKCPHLGCTIPWRPDFEFQGVKGWFRCPCHGSTYTKDGGIIVFGPAPRPMDVFPLEVTGDGGLVVSTGIEYSGTGSDANPERAVPIEPGNITPPLA